MRRMPHALPAIDAAAARHAMPSDVERVALVTNPFGAELKGPAGIAFLHDQLVTLRRFPEFAIESFAHRLGRRHSGRQIGFRFDSHRGYLRRIRSLTGATIGPDTTIEISASFT